MPSGQSHAKMEPPPQVQWQAEEADDAPVKMPSKEEVARAIRRRNSLARSRCSSLTPADLDIARKLSYSAALENEVDPAHKVQIVIRIRPLAEDEQDSTESPSLDGCFRVLTDSAMLARPPKTSQAHRSTGTATSFQFSRIFRPSTQQDELFRATTKPVLEAAFAGKSGLVFAYGVTNSGKTYTISGTEDEPGVLPRALQFVTREQNMRKENDAKPIAKITASYLEIYNENVYDLIPQPQRKRHALRLQDCDGKIQVKGATEREITSVADGEEVLAIGRRNKQVAETKSNSDSSRSHCVFTFNFYQKSRSRMVLRSRVSIVDLAGSERTAKTGAKGLRIQEASKINGSLMNLMRCLETLRWNQQHPPNLQKMVPFRESKLTRLFQENLIGRKNGPLVMIVAVNPSSHEFDETLRTLKYSAVAQELVHDPTRSSLSRKSMLAVAFYDQNGRLRKRKRPSTESEASDKTRIAPSRRGSAATHSTDHSLGAIVENASGIKREPATVLVQSQPKPEMCDATTSPMESQRELEERELQWAKLELENEELRMELSQLNAEKLQLEVQIRAEIGNEMRDQLQQIREHYQSMAARAQRTEDLPSARKRDRQHADEVEGLHTTIQELRDKLRECEDEMQRMDKRHKRELEQQRGENGSVSDKTESR